MMKWRDLASCQAASAGPAAKSRRRVADRRPRMRMELLSIVVRAKRTMTRGASIVQRLASEEAVRVDIDRDPHLRSPFDLREPVANDVLHVEAARGMDEQALPMAPPEHRQWSRGGAEDRHAIHGG